MLRHFALAFKLSQSFTVKTGVKDFNFIVIDGISNASSTLSLYISVVFICHIKNQFRNAHAKIIE